VFPKKRLDKLDNTTYIMGRMLKALFFIALICFTAPLLAAVEKLMDIIFLEKGRRSK
jgi:hypothetical protein